jgi:hypothetical protein
VTRREDIHKHWDQLKLLERDVAHFAMIWEDRGCGAVFREGDPNNRQGFERFSLVWDAGRLPVPGVVRAQLRAFNARLQNLNVEYWDRVSRWKDDEV